MFKKCNHDQKMEPCSRNATMIEKWNHVQEMEPCSKNGTMFKKCNHVQAMELCSRYETMFKKSKNILKPFWEKFSQISAQPNNLILSSLHHQFCATLSSLDPTQKLISVLHIFSCLFSSLSHTFLWFMDPVLWHEKHSIIYGVKTCHKIHFNALRTRLFKTFLTRK